MAIEQQMNMLARGGLDDDGMSRDPVSGNTIPAGSMANEVRDDVDAKLSDGEYVVPANVVRFFGVKFFEDLRTQAMQGLGTMEANGRIGGEPMPSDMPMQDQMAGSPEELSEQDMAMLQNIMNEGGDVRGYAHGGYHDPVNDPQPIPQSFPSSVYPLTQYATPGASTVLSNLNPNLPPSAITATPDDLPLETNNPEFRFVTMVNPVNGNIQVVQFKGDVPVDANAYNQLINSGFYVQGSPELAAYNQKIEQDNRESDRPPERDSAGRLVTRPSPKGASISELAQLISESSKGGGSILGSIPSLMGAVQGKAATGYQDQITKTLAERIANPDLAVHEVKALQALQDIWTNTDLSKKDRVEAISKTLLYVPPSMKNALGKKKGKFGSENWFGYATDDDIRRLYGSYSEPTFKINTATDASDAEKAADRLATGKGTSADRAAETKRLEDYNRIMTKSYDDEDNNKPPTSSPVGFTGGKSSSSKTTGNYGGAENREVSPGTSFSSTSKRAVDLAASGSGNYGGRGGRAKGGLINKPTKKKNKKTKK